MGRLFEGITFDYQAEMRKMREATEAAEREIEAARQSAQQEIEAARQSARQEIEAAEQKKIEAQKIEEIANQTVKFSNHIARMALDHHTASEIKNSLMEEFGLTKEEAEKEYQRVIE